MLLMSEQRTHLPHEIAPPQIKKPKKSYYQKKKTSYSTGHLSRRCGEVVLVWPVVQKTKEELEEEEKFAKCRPSVASATRRI